MSFSQAGASPFEHISLDPPAAESSHVLLGSGKGVALCGDYEPLSGVPTRVLRPTSTFTCHSFSNDGSRLATGEIDGTISLWNTVDYSCIAKGDQLFQHAISALSFLQNEDDALIAVDKKGNVHKCRLVTLNSAEGPSNSSSLDYRLELGPLLVSASTKGDHGHLGNDILKDQFSDDGQTLAHIRYHRSQYKLNLRRTSVDVYRFDTDPCRHKTISFEEPEIGLPILSRNGKSLLACFFCKRDLSDDAETQEDAPTSEILVVPEIDFEANQQKQIQLDGERASWGLRGEYLLLWDSDHSKPRLSIFETAAVREQEDTASPLAQIDLAYGLTSWKAQILEDESSVDDKLEVVLYQVCNEKRVLQIWDVEQDTITKETNLMMPPQQERKTSALESNDNILASASTPNLPVMSMESLSSLVTEDVFPKFCVSSDGNWIGAIADDSQSGILSSLRAGATAWNFDSLDEFRIPPFVTSSHVKFDPQARHFLIIGDSAILACAPTFLEKSSATLQQLTTLHQGLAVQDRENDKLRLLGAYMALPSRTLAKIWQSRFDGKSRLLWFQSRRTERRSGELEFLDASLSPDGLLLALIVRTQDGTSFVATKDSRVEEPDRHDEFGGLKFPRRFENHAAEFTPERVFAFSDDEGNHYLALLSRGANPIAVFCNLSDQSWKSVALPMKHCLKISAVSKKTEVALLDEDGVCILDLQRQQVSLQVPYDVDFNRLLSSVQTYLQWRRQETVKLEEITEPCISDDGCAVLLGWDARNMRSIVVSPFMSHNDCEELIRQTGGSLSDCCSLFVNGGCTLFVDLKMLKKGCVAVGLFNESERKVLYHFIMDHSLPKGLSRDDKNRLLEKISYGLNVRGSLLVAHTREMKSDSYSTPMLRDGIKVFGIHAAAGCVPNYELLTLARTTSLEHSIEEMHDKHGFSSFNTPSAHGTTVFQEAIIKRNKRMASRIAEIAKDHEFELSMEWTTPKGKSRNILQEALVSRNTNEIKDAIEHVCSPIAPFRSAAAIMKRSFSRLMLSYRDMMEDALSRNLLVHEVCKMKVHVNYMNLALRRDRAVHIDTSNTCLDWSQVDDEKSLEKTWKDRNWEEVQRMESDGNTSTTTACLKFIRIENAAKTGMRGILRPMLLQKMPTYFYQFDVVKWIIRYKWLKVWKERFIWKALQYFLFLIFFSLYVTSLATSANFTDERHTRKITTTSFLAVTFVFGLFTTIEEIQKIRTYLKDGVEHSKTKWKGLQFFLMFGWNWLDLISCLLLTVFIPIVHIMAMFHSEFDKVLSSIVAVEAIVAFAKVWYFAQPFRVSGALVRMFSDIIRDCLAFLVLATIIIIGFSLSLHVLFRHHEEDLRLHDQDEDEDDDPVPFAFGSFWSSLLTMYYASLGNFDQEVYRAAGNLTWQTSITFMTYLLVQMIVLLNLLISIMGDTFDRVKDNEEAQLLVGRARFVDSCEASLTESERDRIDKEIGRYLYVLESENGNVPSDSSELWTGRLRQLESRFRESITQSKNSMKKALGNLEERILGKTKTMLDGLEENILRQVKGLIGMQHAGLEETVGSVSFGTAREELRRESLELREEGQSLTGDARQLSGRMDQLESKFEEWQLNTDAQLTEILTLLRKEEHM